MNITYKTISDGVIHKVPTDLKNVLLTDTKALSTWEDITPLARNEWLCWIESVKLEKTRLEHVNRAVKDLAKGKRRPCCWLGCIHRTDKAMSASQKFIIGKRGKK